MNPQRTASRNIPPDPQTRNSPGKAGVGAGLYPVQIRATHANPNAQCKIRRKLHDLFRIQSGSYTRNKRQQRYRLTIPPAPSKFLARPLLRKEPRPATQKVPAYLREAGHAQHAARRAAHTSTAGRNDSGQADKQQKNIKHSTFPPATPV